MSNLLSSDSLQSVNQYLNSDVYHNQNSLSELKRKGRDDNPEALREAAKQFESIFTRMMLKSMRKASAAIIEKPLFDSAQLGMYQDMYDEQLSLHLSRSNGGLGLTDVLVKQLSGIDTSNSNTKFKTSSIEESTPSIIENEKKKTHSNFNQIIIQRSNNQPLKTIQVTMDHENAVQNITAKNIGTNNTVQKPTRVDPPEERGLDFSSPSSFVQSLWPYAQKAAKSLSLDPKLLIAQAALETGWGKFVIKNNAGDSSKNLFGVKSSDSWKGEVTTVSSVEVESGIMSKKESDFRVYDSYEASFSDYANFIQGKSRYQNALSASKDSTSYIHELQKAGYATDPDYANKIDSIYRSSTLSDAVKTFSGPGTSGLGDDE